MRTLPPSTPRRARRPRLVVAASLVTLAIIAACKDGTGPARGPGGMRIVAGAATTDTIGGRPVQALVVEVRDSIGRVLRGADVHFRAVVRASNDPFQFGQETMVLRSRQDQLMLGVNDSTDANGRAWVQYVYGTIAGEGGIEFSVPALGYVDTARYTILPGKPAYVTSEPADTAALAGGMVQLRGVVRDRAGNARIDAVQWRTLTGSATVAASGLVSLGAPGVSRLAAVFGDFADTSSVGGLPAGTIAAFEAPGNGSTSIVLFGTDGSAKRARLTTAWENISSYNWLPHWSPAAARLVFQREGSGSRLWVADTLGAFARLTTDVVPVTSEQWPQVSADGQWVYFQGGTAADYASLWRVRMDGTGMESLATGRAQYVADLHPAPSPDGMRVAFASNRSGALGFGYSLFVLDLATGTVRPLNVPGFIPRWSPTGDHIAYLRDGQLRVVNADGTNDRAVGSNVSYPFSWSPDGKWILGPVPYSSGFGLVDVETGGSILVPGSARYSSPAWVR